MQVINYPLLYYPIGEQAVLGMLVGTDYKMVEADLKSVRMGLLQFLQKDYKKYDYYPIVEITSPKLKILEINIRPKYRDQSGVYPSSSNLKIPVPIIYGATENNYFECYLPLFNESFYYYDSKQFNSLVNYFATNLLNQYTPEELHQFLVYPTPALDIISLRVKKDRETHWYQHTARDFELLNRLCEPYPYSKAIRKSMNTFPEAAWELEGKVNLVVEKLLYQGANVIVVGKHGVGKSAVLKQAIRKIDTLSRKNNYNRTFWRIQAQRITASSKYLGEWQQACEDLVEELSLANGILWVTDMIRLLQTGGEGAEDSVAAFWSSFLQEGRLRLIGELTVQELESMRRMLPNFVQSFQIVQIDELPEKKIHAILDKIAEFSNEQLKINIEGNAMQLAYRLLLRYFPYESFPGKAIKFLGQCVSEAAITQSSSIDKNAVIEHFIKQTGLPALFLRDDLLLDNTNLQQFFQSRIIGQDQAINKLTGIIKIFKAGLNNPYKPIATLLFAGPTGVGKTASAKALADYFFGEGQKKTPLIRIDMSEFQHPSQISRFIGAGREVGQLVQDIRERPFSVLLLDEVEKANPAIFDALLTVLDEGMLVDAFGRVTNFRNTIIIMTTNLGASNRNSIGFAENGDEEANYLSAIGRYFRPEFVNRIDSIVPFNSLTRGVVEQIARKELLELQKREGIQKRRIELQFSDAVVEFLMQVGFDERYGARPLQRAIEQQIVAPIAAWLLDHTKLKNKILKVDYLKEKILLSSK